MSNKELEELEKLGNRVIAVVRLKKGDRYFYDIYSGIHLTVRNPEAEVRMRMNTAGLIEAVARNKLVLVSGVLDTHAFLADSVINRSKNDRLEKYNARQKAKAEASNSKEEVKKSEVKENIKEPPTENKTEEDTSIEEKKPVKKSKKKKVAAED